MTLLSLFWSFLQVGLFSIGGGYAAMPLIQAQVVDGHGWRSMAEFTDLITIAEMTPVPIAVNSATFVGLRIAGVAGAVVATFGCVLPSLVLVSLLARIYYRHQRGLVLRGVLGSLRPAVVALIASACSIVGAMLGLALPTDIIQTCLGVTILGIAVLLFFSKNSVRPVVNKQDAVGLALGMNGVFLEPSTGEVVDWKTHRTLAGLLLFIVIGIMAGMFGLGAGWANVPVLNLLMGVPLKVSVGTSKFLLSITDTSAAWVYLNQGCVIPLMAIPSIVGLMLGSVVGVRLLAKAKPKFIRIMVIAVLFFSGAKALLKGLGW